MSLPWERDTLVIEPDTWEACGGEDDPTAKLHTTITLRVHGEVIELHLDALAVEPGSDPQSGVQGVWGEFDGWASAAGGDGPMSTIAINGREYCVFASPFC